MKRPPRKPDAFFLRAEKVAYWYFRLNGFFQIDNFVVHPKKPGSQPTDADLIAVRFPYRGESLLDDPADVMLDDKQGLSSADARDFIFSAVGAMGVQMREKGHQEMLQ